MESVSVSRRCDPSSYRLLIVISVTAFKRHHPLRSVGVYFCVIHSWGFCLHAVISERVSWYDHAINLIVTGLLCRTHAGHTSWSTHSCSLGVFLERAHTVHLKFLFWKGCCYCCYLRSTANYITHFHAPEALCWLTIIVCGLGWVTMVVYFPCTDYTDTCF